MRAWGAEHDRGTGESADTGEHSEVPVYGNRRLEGGDHNTRHT